MDSWQSIQAQQQSGFLRPLSNNAKPSVIFRAESGSNTSFSEGYLYLEKKGERDVVVIAVWAKGLAGVYSAEEAATKLGYSDTGLDRRRKLWHHRDEYLGGGTEHEIVFECPLYQVPAMIPSGFFPGRRSGNALQDIACEIYSHSGAFDDMKRDELVKAITRNPQFFPTIR
ncbi:hypothetical protein BDW71DRAFT_217091 [Aspergillus fruticulosus]